MSEQLPRWHVHCTSDTDDFGRWYDARSISESEDNPWDAFAFSVQFSTMKLPDGVEEKFALMAAAPAMREVIRMFCEAWLNVGGTTDLLAYQEAQKILYPDLD